MSRPFHVTVRKLPVWLDWQRLLGDEPWQVREEVDGWLEVEAELSRIAAADLSARLRKVGIGGSWIELDISPPLNRRELRKAMTEEARRYRKGSIGFSKSGAKLDSEGKFSLTPEAIALELGKRAGKVHVLDAFAGAGGNAIGFARAGCRVTAVELNKSRLAMARHNARLYGVADRIQFIAGDACEELAKQKADLLFLDPPWGERYNKERVSLDELPPCAEVLAKATAIPHRWLKVPPSFDTGCLPDYEAEAIFGVGPGDNRRVKFLLMSSSQVTG